MKTKAWSEYLESPETEARYELDIDGGRIIDARIIGYFTDKFGGKHEFVRWDGAHGKFHKHHLYEKKQWREDINRPLKKAISEAIQELRSEWGEYMRAYIRNHIKNKNGQRT
jgi:hypothetical protein